jgi:LEA14-like dessication related protein
MTRLPGSRCDKERSALLALTFVIIFAMAAETYASHSIYTPNTQPKIIFGDLQLRSTSVDVTGLGDGGLSLDLDAVIYNPNNLGATLKGANYSVYADGRLVGSGQTKSEYALAPRSSLTLAFPVTVGWNSAFETTGSYLVGLGHVTWSIKGIADSEVGGFAFLVSFELAVD